MHLIILFIKLSNISM